LTLFEVALRQLQDIVASRLAFGMEADITVIFYNTASNTRDLKGVHVWHPASAPSVDLLERLHNCSAVKFEFEHHGMKSFRNALAAAILEFYDGKISADVQLVVAAWTCLQEGHFEEKDAIVQSTIELLQKRDAFLQIICVDDETPEDVTHSSRFSEVFRGLGANRKCCSTWNILKDPFNSGDMGLLSHTVRLVSQ
jgi:hypothetical protein